MKEYSKLLDEYLEIKDELLDYTNEFHDAMFWDASGYAEEDGDIDDLRKQVGAFRKILEGLKQIEYVYS